MVHKKYVKRRKRRIVSLILTSVATLAVVSFSIIALIGRNLGDFTISVNNTGPVISLSKDNLFTDLTTFYKVEQLPSFEVYTSRVLPSDDKIDSSETDGSLGNRVDINNKITSLYFFKLTYYIKNTGTVVANYEINLSFAENVKPSNTSYGLDDILRVRLYENTDTLDKETNAHQYRCFAKKSNSSKLNEDGELTYKEYESTNESRLCEEFNSEMNIFSLKTEGLAVDNYLRYTLLFYLEGEDPECSGEKPKESSLKLALTYKTYEKEETPEENS